MVPQYFTLSLTLYVFHLMCSIQAHTKRKYGKQKPERGDFASEEEYITAYTRWRERRDKNNKAVRGGGG